MGISNDKEFNRFSITYFDLEKALSYANEARNFPDNPLICEALLTAAIISYCRPFSSNEKNKNSPASSRVSIEDFQSISKSEKKIHDECICLRNKALAHSEYTRNPTRLNQSTSVIISRPFSLLPLSFDLTDFISLVEKLILACHNHRANYKEHLPIPTPTAI